MSPTIHAQIPLVDPAPVEECAKYAIADLHEALGAVRGRQALMSPRMRPLLEGRRIAGVAVTSYNYPGDNLMIHVALNLAQKGQVLVLSNGGGIQGALWGELAGTYARKKGVAGVVVDGPIRDVAALRELGIPVWATSISPSHPEKRGPGSVNVPIVVDGVLVEPGDVIVADEDGVLAIPRAELARAVDGAKQRAQKEVSIRERIETGEALYDILNIDAAVQKAGISRAAGTWQQSRAARE